jgi:P4 family phage/plasmid primase-like protien
MSDNPHEVILDAGMRLRFFRSVFGAEDLILIRPTETWVQDGKKQSKVDYQFTTYHQLDVLLDVLESHLKRAVQTKSNIFFGVAPRHGGKGQYDRAFQIRTVRVLWADLDHTTVEEALRRCKDARLPTPSIVVRTGSGVHLYWLLEEAYLIDDGDQRPVLTEWSDQSDPKTGKKKARRYVEEPQAKERLYLDLPANRPSLSPKALFLQDVLAGIAEAIGGDHTIDPSRLMRVPETWNRKDERNGRPPAPCKLVSIDESLRYPLSRFLSLADSAPTRKDREVIETIPLPRSRPVSASKQDKLDSFVVACRTAKDRSRADWAFVCYCIENGVADDVAWAAVDGVGKFADRGKPYFEETWEKAVAHTQRKIYAKAKEKSDGDSGDAKARSGVSIVTAPRIAKIICNSDRFAQDPGGKLYVFSNGVYRPRGDERIRARVKRICDDVKRNDEWKSHLANETVEYIRVDSPELWERPSVDVLNVANGLLNVTTRKLAPHSADWLSPVQLPVAFNEAATCKKIENFCSDVFPEDAIVLAYEIVAWVILPDGSIQKAVLLIGSGGNGKSRYLRMVLSFVGKPNVSSLSLHRLESDKFACGRLVGKLANICPDLPSAHLAGTSTFKAITGGDEITGEHKFMTSFDFTPFCKLVFSANNAPRADDSSEGFFDRWKVVPFDRRFRGERVEIPAAVLDAMLSEPDELSGLLNKALDVLPDLRRRGGFIEASSTEAAFKQFHATTDPFSVWLDANAVDEPGAVILQAALVAAYAKHCEQKGIPPMTKNLFGRSLRKLRPQVVDRQRTIAGKANQWCYVGIGLRCDQGSVTTDATNRPSSGDCQRDQRDQRDSAYLVQLTHARSELAECNEVHLGEQDKTNPVDLVVSVEPADRAACDHEPRESATFDGFIRTECRRCGRVLAADRRTEGSEA